MFVGFDLSAFGFVVIFRLLRDLWPEMGLVCFGFVVSACVYLGEYLVWLFVLVAYLVWVARCLRVCFGLNSFEWFWVVLRLFGYAFGCVLCLTFCFGFFGDLFVWVLLLVYASCLI